MSAICLLKRMVTSVGPGMTSKARTQMQTGAVGGAGGGGGGKGNVQVKLQLYALKWVQL